MFGHMPAARSSFASVAVFSALITTAAFAATSVPKQPGAKHRTGQRHWRVAGVSVPLPPGRVVARSHPKAGPGQFSESVEVHVGGRVVLRLELYRDKKREGARAWAERVGLRVPGAPLSALEVRIAGASAVRQDVPRSPQAYARSELFFSAPGLRLRGAAAGDRAGRRLLSRVASRVRVAR